jgi:hypothetical protein
LAHLAELPHLVREQGRDELLDAVRAVVVGDLVGVGGELGSLTSWTCAMCWVPPDRVVPSVPMASLIDRFLLLVLIRLVRWTLLADAGHPTLERFARRPRHGQQSGWR